MNAASNHPGRTLVAVTIAALGLTASALGAARGETRPDDRPQSKRVLMNACAGKTTPGYWIEQLRDRDPDARARAARALGEMRDRTAVAALVQALGDANQNVRIAAVQALGRLGPGATAATPVLRQMLAEEDRRLRDEVSRSLEKIAPASPK